MVDINDFTIQKDCNYKDDSYSVRDNGAIMRTLYGRLEILHTMGISTIVECLYIEL